MFDVLRRRKVSNREDDSPGPGRSSVLKGMFWLAVSAGMAYIRMLSSKDLMVYGAFSQHTDRM